MKIFLPLIILCFSSAVFSQARKKAQSTQPVAAPQAEPAVTAPSYSQTSPGVKWAAGIGINYTEADIDGADGADYDDQLSFQAGVRANIELNPGLSFRTGAFLTQKKIEGDTTILGTKITVEADTLYLNIPLTLAYSINPTVAFFGGLSPMIKVSDDCEISGGGVTVDCDDAAEMKSTYIPVVLGFGFDLNESVGLELAYERALTEASDDLKFHSMLATVFFKF